MCGIAGFYSFDSSPDRRRMQAAGEGMLSCIVHRGPDSGDHWQDPDVPLLLAQRRLAIIDLSPDGKQPMMSHTGRYVIVYNGEIYDYKTLRAELEVRGHHFIGHSDTEVFLTAIEEWGIEKTLGRIDGMFAVALWDRQAKKLHFIRDRFGKKPLYMGWAGRSLVFGSELKVFHAHPDFTPEIARDVLAQYMQYGYVCAPHSIFRNVWQMLPGGWMTLDMDGISPGENLRPRMSLYWSLRAAVEEARAHPVLSDEDSIIAEFEGLVEDSVRERMVSDVPLGVFLSGGIDSSLVTALMQKNSSRPVKSFSIGFEEDGYDEAQAASKVAAHLGTDHQAFTLTSAEAMKVIPLLSDMFDEPFADASQIPTYLISKLARQSVTVALTGDGGDEILGGYQRHTHVPALWNKVSWMPEAVRRTAGSILLKVPQNAYDRLRPSYPQFGRRVHRMLDMVAQGDGQALYTSLLQVWPERDFVVPGVRPAAIPLDDSAQWPSGLTLAEKLIYADTLSYRPNDLMVKTDRACMAVALEARAPLMDFRLCEYSWRLPHAMKIRGFEGKWLLRRLLEKYVPKALYDRPKTGFGVPVGSWLKGPLKGWGEELLSLDRLKKQNILNAELVSGRWRDFQAGRGGHANASDLWAALMFQAWYDRWMKR